MQGVRGVLSTFATRIDSSIVILAGLEGICDPNTTSERRESISRGNLSSIRLPESTQTTGLPYALQSYRATDPARSLADQRRVLDIQLASKPRSL
jgi:hypothetical protein